MRPNPFESQLERLARTLTEQFNVELVCQGDQAWTDGSRIVIPSVPEPMDESLERMMVGYLDHEMAHVAFSDFNTAGEFERKYPGCLGMLNVVEDARIERDAMARWPGVRRNLDLMFEQIKPRVQQLIQQRSPFDRFCTAVYLGLSHHQDMLGLEPELAGYEDLLDDFAHVHTTADAASLAARLLERWQRQAAPEPPQPDRSPDEDRDAAAGAGPQEASSSQAGTPPQEGDEREVGDSDSADGSRGQPSETNRSTQSPEAGVDGNESPGAHGTTAAKPEPQSPADGKESPPARPPMPPNHPNETDTAAAKASEGYTSPGAGGLPGSLIGEAVEGVIAEQIAQIDASAKYRPYTRRYDHLEPVEAAKETEVRELLESDRDVVRRLRRGLTNALRSAEKRWWKDDQARGALSPRKLYRLGTDRCRLDVFRTRSVVQGRSTAVCVVLDASGSMSRRKMDVARRAMRVLIEALSDLKVATEAFTFTTGNLVDIAQVMQQTGFDAARLRERYGRLSNLEIGVIKRFDEPAKAALQRLPNVQGSGLTPLGEAMHVAASRLLPRPESRKVMLVLTDGKAGCEGGSDSATTHAQHMAGLVTKAGMELIGLGILDDNLCAIVEDTIVVQQLDELPARLCKLLGRTLTKGLKHVG